MDGDVTQIVQNRDKFNEGSEIQDMNQKAEFQKEAESGLLKIFCGEVVN